VQGGNSDTALNENGQEQAERLALRLKPEKVQAIYSSPLQRAFNTAQAIARQHHLEVQAETALMELNVGELEGIPVEQLGKRLDELLIMRGQDETQAEVEEGVAGWVKKVGGESLSELQQRAWSTIQRLVSQHPDGVIVVVSHYFVILTIICAVLNLPLSQMRRLRLGVGGISTIVFDEPVFRLTLFNDSCHLMA
jgi:probable phosphoglycerate mutase